MNTSGFYKIENDELFYGPNFVYSKDYELTRETHEDLEYPVDGWYWFDSEEEAREFFNLPDPLIVERYKFLGQLAKEVMAGDDNEMQQALTQAGAMTNLLITMTMQSQDIPEVMKPEAVNEIQEAKTFRRDHPFIDLFGPAFGHTTEEQKDAFFIRANNYKFGA